MNRATALSIISNSTGLGYFGTSTAGSNNMYNISLTSGLSDLFGIPVVIDSNMSNGDVLLGDPSAIHLNFAGDVEFSNWLDRDSLTEKFQIACAAGAGAETASCVLGSNSIS